MKLTVGLIIINTDGFVNCLICKFATSRKRSPKEYKQYKLYCRVAHEFIDDYNVIEGFCDDMRRRESKKL